MELNAISTPKIKDFSSLSLEDLHAFISQQNEKIEELTQQLNWFKEQFNLLRHKRFAASSEKQTVVQPDLFDEGLLIEADDDNKNDEPEQQHIDYVRKKPQRKSKNLDTSHLPREKRYIDLSEEEKRCACGCDLEKIGEEIKEEIEFQPSQLKVIEHVRLKYTCRACETVSMPRAIELPILKSKASGSLLAEVILNKYSYHLPLYRQQKMLAQHRILIPDNTLGGWVMKSAEQLSPLGEALWEELPSIRALQVDETPVKLLEPEKKAFMWLYHSYLPEKRFIIFDFSLSRQSSHVNERLKNFSGLLQTDGYSGYNMQRARSEIISIGCWDHARRKFVDVVKSAGNNKSGKAGKMLEMVASLYDIEEKIKDLPFEERKAIRQKEAKPQLALIYQFLYSIHAPPKSLLNLAVTYCKNQWHELIRYADYGEAQISNCWIENKIRPFAVGRKNWLFVGNVESATRAGLLYSLICKSLDFI